MKEYILSSIDYATIKDIAHKNYINNAIKHDNFVTECFTKAIISFLASRKLVIKDGKVYEEIPEKEF